MENIEVTIEAVTITSEFSSPKFGVHISYNPNLYSEEDDEVLSHELLLDEKADSLKFVKNNLSHETIVPYLTEELGGAWALFEATDLGNINLVTVNNIMYLKQEWKTILQKYDESSS